MINDKILEAFSFGVLQDCKNVKQLLDEHGIEWEEFLEWLEDKKKRVVSVPRSAERMRPARAVLHRLCPGCKENFLRLSQVNHRPEAMIGGKWKSQWRCFFCEWEELSEGKVNEEAKPYIKGV